MGKSTVSHADRLNYSSQSARLLRDAEELAVKAGRIHSCASYPTRGGVAPQNGAVRCTQLGASAPPTGKVRSDVTELSAHRAQSGGSEGGNRGEHQTMQRPEEHAYSSGVM